ncbi:MAG: hypothetical protein ACREU2_11115 [Steroidobacteraceae bacterium]
MAFTGGVVVGVATGLVGVGVAVAAERARRRAAGSHSGSPSAGNLLKGRPDEAPVLYPPTGEAELDEELAQTFPASDPLPHPHHVD